MNFNENDLLREKTELLYLRISKLERAKVLLKLEFDTEDQVLYPPPTHPPDKFLNFIFTFNFHSNFNANFKSNCKYNFNYKF